MSVPIAVVGLIPNSRTSSGVIRDPPPIPVMPTRNPTPKPKKTIAGSMFKGSYPRQLDEAAFPPLFPFMTERVLKGGADHSEGVLFPLIAGVSSDEWS